MDTRKLKLLYETTELTLENIANELGTTYAKVQKFVANQYSSKTRKQRKSVTYRNSKLGDKNPMTGLYGDKHHNYLGVISDNKGYLICLKPDWYTGRKNSKHVFVHTLVVCKELGLTEIPKGYIVHHCDQNPHNNDFSNLVMMTMGEHVSIHRILESATTISKESTLKWVEARRAGSSYDIVSSI